MTQSEIEPEIYGLWRSVSTNYTTANPLLIYCVILQVAQNVQIGQLKYSAFEYVTDTTGPPIQPVYLPKKE